MVTRLNGDGKYLCLMTQKAIQLCQDGKLLEARSMFEELLAQNPHDPQLHYELGMLCMEQQKNHAACDHFRELVRLAPDFLEGRMLLGMMLAELGQHVESASWLEGVVAEVPGVAEIHHRLGLVYTELSRYQDAYNAYLTVLRLKPDHVGVRCSLGLLLSTTGHISEARQVFQEGLALDPTSVNIINNMGRVCKIGKAAESLDWFQRGLDLDPEHPSLTSNYLYTLNYVPGLSSQCIAEKYMQYASRCYRPRIDWHCSQERRTSRQRVRIGYLSADFYGHSVTFFLEPVIQQHDPSRFEIFCYSNRTAEDATTERLRSYSTEWRCIVGMTDLQVAESICADEIDILVELSGHTAGNRLGVCAMKPAPIQVSWIGHPNTTGLPQMDYYLTDAWCDPPGMTEGLYSERLFRLPRVFSCYLPPEEFPPVAPVPSLESGGITFGCFNSPAKINDQLIGWWAEILHRQPSSRFLIKGPSLDDLSCLNDMLEAFSRFGVSKDRLVIQGLSDTRLEHLARYAEVDIALDTFPYHGTTTTCEALWMGVPVVTLTGDTHVSRVGLSLLHAVGLDELIVKTPKEYVEGVIALADNRQRLLYLRENLRLMMARSPLMDYTGVTREVEEAYLQMQKERRSS